MTDITNGLHLTINDNEQLISLWDSEDSAKAQRYERYVHLDLTPEQRILLTPITPKTRILARVEAFARTTRTDVTDLTRDLATLLEELS